MSLLRSQKTGKDHVMLFQLAQGRGFDLSGPLFLLRGRLFPVFLRVIGNRQVAGMNFSRCGSNSFCKVILDFFDIEGIKLSRHFYGLKNHGMIKPIVFVDKPVSETSGGCKFLCKF